ncbi:MAG TPA: non-ribosomal peptide synthetase, partial [Acidobacteria bacterium]|nr:non-ribosomal peptide synthetase [Acidobacteriota bacterium]
LEAFTAAFGAAGFRPEAFFPCYGMAETTLIVSGRSRGVAPTVRSFRGLEEHRVEEGEGSRLVGCGPAGLGLEIAIADPETGAESGPDAVGEILVSGGSVALGYWGRPEATEAAFHARLAHFPSRTFLRTGDLGFLRDGELFVTGRLKDLIIVRGRNHYPQDLEATAAASHPALVTGAGAAFSVEGPAGESVALVQEIDPRRTAEAAEALDALRESVVEAHEIPLAGVVLVKTGALPKTTSGKVQRRLCRRLFEEGALPAVATWSAGTADDLTEPGEEPEDPLARLQALVAAKLGLRAVDVDPHRSLAALGLDSLATIELSHETGLALTDLLEAPDLAALAAALPTPTQAPALPAGSGDGLSEGERSLWFLYQVDPTSPAYHIAGAARLPDDADLEALHRAFQGLVDRHPALRTTFHAVDGEPVRRVHVGATVDFQVGETEIDAEIFRPFDLEQGPLLRVRVVREADGGRTLLLVIHHLIADFWSLAVMVRELGTEAVAGSPGHKCPGYEAAPAEAGLKPRSRGAAASPGIYAR